MDELILFANKQNATNKATCMEVFEYATKKTPAIASDNLLKFAIRSLSDEEARVKWESAKVIGNVVKFFPNQLTECI